LKNTPIKKRIIFYAFSSQSWDSYVPIIAAILEQKQDAIEWMGVCAPCDNYDFINNRSKDLFELLKKQFNKPAESNIENQAYYKYILVTTHVPEERHGLNNGFYIHVPHGSAFGNNLTANYLLSCYQASDIYCGISPKEEEYIIQSNKNNQEKVNKFIATGCPKNDSFAEYISGSEQDRFQIKLKIKEEMNIDKDNAVIFIASHWTSRGILRRFGASLIQALSTLGDKIQIIQGAHPNLWNNHVSPQTSTWIYNSLCKECNEDSIQLSLGVSDAKALLVSDIVIGDISSIVIEAALLEKPILLNIDRDSFQSDQIYDIYKGMSIQFEGADDLLQTFINGAEFPKDREKTFATVKNMFGYNIGNASKQIAAIIINSITN
jgi:hypothetical protein